MWLNAKQTAEWLGVDYKSVRDWAKDPLMKFPAFLPPGNKKQWKANTDDLDKWAHEKWRPIEME